MNNQKDTTKGINEQCKNSLRVRYDFKTKKHDSTKKLLLDWNPLDKSLLDSYTGIIDKTKKENFRDIKNLAYTINKKIISDKNKISDFTLERLRQDKEIVDANHCLKLSQIQIPGLIRSDISIKNLPREKYLSVKFEDRDLTFHYKDKRNNFVSMADVTNFANRKNRNIDKIMKFKSVSKENISKVTHSSESGLRMEMQEKSQSKSFQINPPKIVNTDANSGSLDLNRQSQNTHDSVDIIFPVLNEISNYSDFQEIETARKALEKLNVKKRNIVAGLISKFIKPACEEDLNHELKLIKREIKFSSKTIKNNTWSKILSNKDPEKAMRSIDNPNSSRNVSDIVNSLSEKSRKRSSAQINTEDFGLLSKNDSSTLPMEISCIEFSNKTIEHHISIKDSENKIENEETSLSTVKSESSFNSNNFDIEEFSYAEEDNIPDELFETLIPWNDDFIMPFIRVICEQLFLARENRDRSTAEVFAECRKNLPDEFNCFNSTKSIKYIKNLIQDVNACNADDSTDLEQFKHIDKMFIYEIVHSIISKIYAIDDDEDSKKCMNDWFNVNRNKMIKLWKGTSPPESVDLVETIVKEELNKMGVIKFGAPYVEYNNPLKNKKRQGLTGKLICHLIKEDNFVTSLCERTNDTIFEYCYEFMVDSLLDEFVERGIGQDHFGLNR